MLGLSLKSYNGTELVKRVSANKVSTDKLCRVKFIRLSKDLEKLDLNLSLSRKHDLKDPRSINHLGSEV
jgi:hypothetical protein